MDCTCICVTNCERKITFLDPRSSLMTMKVKGHFCLHPLFLCWLGWEAVWNWHFLMFKTIFSNFFFLFPLFWLTTPLYSSLVFHHFPNWLVVRNIPSVIHSHFRRLRNLMNNGLQKRACQFVEKIFRFQYCVQT